MKIITVGYLHGSGGAEKQIILLTNQLAQRGHEVTLCVLNEYNSPYPISENVNIVDLTDKEGNGVFRIWRRYRAFKKTVESYNPDIIVNYNLQSAYFCLGISKKARGKVVYSERGDPYDKEYSGLLGKVRDLTVARMDGLVFQSEGARDFFDEEILEKSIVIHNSVNVPQDNYPIPKEREKRIVNVGRLHPQKNQHLLIDAFSQIAGFFPQYTLDIYGDGELHDELQQHINECALNDRIKIHPSRKNIWDCIHKASLFVLTSDYEGMPNALMEAMALGLPCISTDCRPGGARSLIEDGVNGYIVPVRNATELASKISKCLSQQDLSERVATNARQIELTHSDKVLFDKWDNFLQRV